MNEKLAGNKKWYDLMPWWAWILTGFAIAVTLGKIQEPSDLLIAMIYTGLSLFSVVAWITGIVVGIVHLVRWIHRRLKH